MDELEQPILPGDNVDAFVFSYKDPLNNFASVIHLIPTADIRHTG